MGVWALCVSVFGVPAAEAVSQFPGPPLEDPPTSPPHEGRGRSWGERGGTSGARAASSLCCHSGPTQRRSRCDSLSGAAVAAKAASHTLKFGVSANGVTPREPQANDWRDGRAGLISSSHQLTGSFSGPASGLANAQGDDLAGVQRTKQSGVKATTASSSSGPLSRKREGGGSRSLGMGMGRSRDMCRRTHVRPRCQPNSL